MTASSHFTRTRTRSWLTLLAGCLALLALSGPGDPVPPKVRLVPAPVAGDRTADIVTLEGDQQATQVVVRHRHGIGRASLHLQGDIWPSTLVLVFHGFPALEGCLADAVDAAGKSLWPAEVSELRAAPREDKTQPLKVPLPAPPPGTREIRLQWVDDYRN